MRDVVVRERVQQVDAREPVAVAVEHAAAEPHWRNARHAGAVGEGRAHRGELALDTLEAAQHLRHIAYYNICKQRGSMRLCSLLRHSTLAEPKAR
jgi:hypothetical protein